MLPLLEGCYVEKQSFSADVLGGGGSRRKDLLFFFVSFLWIENQILLVKQSSMVPRDIHFAFTINNSLISDLGRRQHKESI